MIKINDKVASYKELKKVLKNDKLKITQFSISQNADPNRVKSKLSHKGFAITKDMIGSMSKEMTKLNAGYMAAVFTDSPHIMGRTLKIILEDPKPKPTWLKKQLIKLGEWLIK